MQVEWVEQPYVIYAFKSHDEYADLGENLSNVRGQCIGFARCLDDGAWEVKLAGPRHFRHQVPTRNRAHTKLKSMVAATLVSP